MEINVMLKLASHTLCFEAYQPILYWFVHLYPAHMHINTG